MKKFFLTVVLSASCLTSSSQAGDLPFLAASEEDFVVMRDAPELLKFAHKEDYGLWAKEHLGITIDALVASDAVSTRDLTDLISGLQLLPKSLLPLAMNPSIKFAATNYSAAGFVTSLPSDLTVTLTAGWIESPSWKKRYTVLHEFGHFLTNKILMDVQHGSRWRTVAPQVISRYAKTNLDEDIAESIVAYRVNPELLWKVSPGKYDFIKSYVYAGVDFRAGADGAPHMNDNSTLTVQTFLEENYGKRQAVKILQEGTHLKTCRAARLNRKSFRDCFIFAAVQTAVSWRKQELPYEDLLHTLLRTATISADSTEINFPEKLQELYGQVRP